MSAERITAHLEWSRRHRIWRIKPADLGGSYLTDIRWQPLRFKTIEAARTALERRGYMLGEIRGYQS